jgi:hypothetical protein
VFLYNLPLEAAMPSVDSVVCPAGFHPLGVAKGAIYGFMDSNGDLTRDEFRALDADSLEVLASYPLVAFQSYSFLHHEGGCILYRGFIENALTLVHFDAVTRRITERTVDRAVLGEFGSLRLAGQGEGWLAFHVFHLQGRNELFTIDATTHEKTGGVNFPGSAAASYIEASGADTQFQIVENGKVLALDVRSGSVSYVGEGVDGAVKYAEDIAARGDVLWVQGRLHQSFTGPAELQMWRKDAGGRWRMEFRGRPELGPVNANPFKRIIATADGCFSHGGSTVVDYYVPALSRPILKVPKEVRLKDGGGKQRVAVLLDRPATEPLSVRVRNGAGTATPGVDFALIDEVLYFPPGSSEAVFEVDIKSDLVPEAHETIELLFSETVGMNLPTVRRGSLVIEASGLELQEVRLLSSNGSPAYVHKLWMRDEELTIGVADVPAPGGTPRVCVWDNRSGVLRGTIPDVPTNVYYPPYPSFLSTPEAVDVHYERDGKFILARVSREDGSVIETGHFRKPPIWTSAPVMLGGGRALFSYPASSGFHGSVARIIEIGGPSEGSSFPNAPPEWSENGFGLISDGRFLIGSWWGRIASDPFAVKVSRFGGFDPVTLAPLWQMDLHGIHSVDLIAIRGNLLLFRTGDGVRAMDLSTREIIWRQPAEYGASVVGDTLWFGSGDAREVYDLATGAAIGAPRHLLEETDASNQFAVGGMGGVLVKGVEVFPEAPGTSVAAGGANALLVSDRRTRPGIQLLNQSIEQTHDGSYFTFRVVEETNVPVEVALRYEDLIPYLHSLPPVYPAPVILPMDGSAAAIPYRFQPLSSLPQGSTAGLAVKVSSPGGPSLAGAVRLPLVSGVPAAPAHLGKVIGSKPASPPASGFSHPSYTGIRACDGKIVAWTVGGGLGALLPAYRVDVYDASTGGLLRSIPDPAPQASRMFGTNAIAQGDKLLVISRQVGSEAYTAEIFSISSGSSLGLLSYTGKTPGFGDVLASNATYFAIGTPGVDHGQPAGSQVEVFRWADFKRVFRRSGGRNSQLGYSMSFEGDTLYVSAPGRTKTGGNPKDPASGKVFGFKIGSKGKVKVPTGTSGVLVANGSSLIVGNPVHLRAYESTAMRLKWSVPFAWNLLSYQGPVTMGESLVAVRDLRDLVMLDEADGRPVGTTRFFTAIDNAFYGDLHGAEFVGGSLFTLAGGKITKWPMNALGDFSTWRWLQGNGGTQDAPFDDQDRNGIADFDEYVASRLNPAAPFASAVHEGGKVKLESVVRPPPDVLVVVEAEVKPGTWSAIGWRDGHGPWAGPGRSPESGPLLVDLPVGSVPTPSLRNRYLPGASLGAGWGKTVWPPEDRIELAATASRVVADAHDGDRDGLPDWLELQLGLQGGDAPLGLFSGPGGAGVSYLRPLSGGGDFDVESSADLRAWQSAKNDPGVEIEVVKENDVHERVTIRGKAGTSQRFFRVKY